MPSEFAREQKVEPSTIKYSRVNQHLQSTSKSMEDILYRLRHNIISHKSSFALLSQTLTSRTTSQIACRIFLKTDGNGKWYRKYTIAKRLSINDTTTEYRKRCIS